MLRPTLPLEKHSAGSHFVWVLLRKHHALQCLPVTMLGKDRLQLAAQQELESQQRGWRRHSTPAAHAWGFGDTQHLSSSSRQEHRQAHVPTAHTNCCLCTHRHTNMHKHAHSTVCTRAQSVCLLSLRVLTQSNMGMHAHSIVCTAQSPTWTLVCTNTCTQQRLSSTGLSGRHALQKQSCRHRTSPWRC